MILEIIRLGLILIGIATTIILFYHFPKLANEKENNVFLSRVSIIIPARNEEKNIALLLGDLAKQNIQIHEIICVDDVSEDKTREVIKSFDVVLLAINDKPKDWIGKSWACESGTKIATGDIFLFLDADVRLSPNAISKLLTTYTKERCAISVQPYHKTEKFYEQFSLFFNFIQLSGNGTGFPKQRTVGFFGPVIMLSRSDYEKIGGHKSVKSSIIEDVALGEQMKNKQIAFKNFVGGEDISFRMYRDGFRSLLQGWTKNMASGAIRAPFLITLPVFLWIAALIAVPLQMFRFAIIADINWVIVYSFLYLLWLAILLILSKKVGKFQIWVILLYPFAMIVFVVVFTISLIKKIFRLKVIWKGRAIDTGEGK